MKKFSLSLILASMALYPAMAAESETSAESMAEAPAEASAVSSSDADTDVYTSVSFSSSSSSSYSQPESEKPKFKFTPTGVAMFDGAVYGPDGDGFNDGVAVPDIRLGGKATFGNWLARVDIGFGFGKLSLKDVFLQYNFEGTNNLIRAGYFVHQFGLNAATSSCLKPTGEAQPVDDFFKATGRNLGVQFILDIPQWFVGVSGMADGAYVTQTTNATGRVSIGAIGRFVWRPFMETGKVVQIGVSPWYQTAMHHTVTEGHHIYTNGSYFTFGANFPTRVAKVAMLGTGNIEDAKNVFKVTPELLLSYDRFAVESQYYFMNVARDNGLGSYQAQGVYGMLRGLIFGDSAYKYSHADAGLAVPGANTLECVLGYSYTDANKNGIRGGISNDYSVTLNYYFNKYFLARLAWHYTDVRNSSVMFNRHVNIVQIRLQAKF